MKAARHGMTIASRMDYVKRRTVASASDNCQGCVQTRLQVNVLLPASRHDGTHKQFDGIKRASMRAARHVVSLDCAALREELALLSVLLVHRPTTQPVASFATMRSSTSVTF